MKSQRNKDFKRLSISFIIWLLLCILKSFCIMFTNYLFGTTVSWDPSAHTVGMLCFHFIISELVLGPICLGNFCLFFFPNLEISPSTKTYPVHFLRPHSWRIFLISLKIFPQNLNHFLFTFLPGHSFYKIKAWFLAFGTLLPWYLSVILTFFSPSYYMSVSFSNSQASRQESHMISQPDQRQL